MLSKTAIRVQAEALCASYKMALHSYDVSYRFGEDLPLLVAIGVRGHDRMPIRAWVALDALEPKARERSALARGRAEADQQKAERQSWESWEDAGE